MTTYRRFCCNDLLRLGSLRTNSGTPTRTMAFYMHHLGAWPGNCHVADAPGGRIAGCILGFIAVDGEDGKDLLGSVSGFTILHKDQNILLLGKMLNMVDDSCRKIYKAQTMKILVRPNHFHVNQTLQELGYEVHRVAEERIEMRKCLSRPISSSPSKDELDRIECSRLPRNTGLSRPISRSSLEDEFDRIESSGLPSNTGLSRPISRSSLEDEFDRIESSRLSSATELSGSISWSPLENEFDRIRIDRIVSSRYRNTITLAMPIWRSLSEEEFDRIRIDFIECNKFASTSS